MNQPQKTTSSKLRWLLWVLLGVLGIFLIIALSLYLMDEPLPAGKSGPQADALAEKMLAAINHPAWENTGAISWAYAGRHELLWDRQRQYVRVCWGGDTEVVLDINRRSGAVWKNDQLVSGKDAEALLTKAWKIWVNDSFWLNPISKVFDEGTSRSVIDVGEGREGLLVTYSSGGATPGDSYLWIIGEDGLPVSWKMWVSILPIGGIELSWEDWITLPTGAKISTRHSTPILDLLLTNVRAAATLAELEPEDDPFIALIDYSY